jgi:hypothetical protein
MKRFFVFSFAALGTCSSLYAQVVSADRTFPPAGSRWMAPEVLTTGQGITFTSMEIADFQGAPLIPSDGMGGVLSPFTCSLKTKASNNPLYHESGMSGQMSLHRTSGPTGQEDYDFTFELFDPSNSNPVQFGLVPGGAKTGHISLIKRTTGDYLVSSTLALDLQYTEDSGRTWSPLTSTANFTLQPIPEPSSLCALTLAGLIALRRKKK